MFFGQPKEKKLFACAFLLRLKKNKNYIIKVVQKKRKETLTTGFSITMSAMTSQAPEMGG